MVTIIFAIIASLSSIFYSHLIQNDLVNKDWFFAYIELGLLFLFLLLSIFIPAFLIPLSNSVEWGISGSIFFVNILAFLYCLTKTFIAERNFDKN